MARARGSYPRCHWFKSSCRYHYKKRTGVRFHIKRPGGQAVKTPPFHGGNTGSSPVRVTTFLSRFIWRHSSAGRALASHARGHRFEFCCLHQKTPSKPPGFDGVFFFYLTFLATFSKFLTGGIFCRQYVSDHYFSTASTESAIFSLAG